MAELSFDYILRLMNATPRSDGIIIARIFDDLDNRFFVIIPMFPFCQRWIPPTEELVHTKTKF